jgi:hypothetical protein
MTLCTVLAVLWTTDDRDATKQYRAAAHARVVGPQALVGSKSGPKILEELGKVPSYKLYCELLEEGALSRGSHSHVSVRLTIKSTFAPGTSADLDLPVVALRLFGHGPNFDGPV